MSAGPQAASPRALLVPPRSASLPPPPRRSLAGSRRAHWRGPGAAPALTPGRPVTSRREGGGSCIFMRRGHCPSASALPAPKPRPQLSAAPLTLQSSWFRPHSAPAGPWWAAAGSPPARGPAPALQITASEDSRLPQKSGRRRPERRLRGPLATPLERRPRRGEGRGRAGVAAGAALGRVSGRSLPPGLRRAPGARESWKAQVLL